MKTKAIVTVEIEINTRHVPVQEGLSENSNPQDLSRSRITEGKKEFIWDEIHRMLAREIEYVQVKEVRFPREAK